MLKLKKQWYSHLVDEFRLAKSCMGSKQKDESGNWLMTIKIYILFLKITVMKMGLPQIATQTEQEFELI